jgi:hypothetical protein
MYCVHNTLVDACLSTHNSLTTTRCAESTIFFFFLRFFLQYFIYNSVGSIDENALNALSLVVELTKHIKTKSESEAGGEPETGAEFANFFPSFLWVIRDFTLQLVDESGASFPPKTYLERALTPMQGFSEGVEVKNRIRRMLLAFFPNRDCVTLKRPGSKSDT